MMSNKHRVSAPLSNSVFKNATVIPSKSVISITKKKKQQPAQNS